MTTRLLLLLGSLWPAATRAQTLSRLAKVQTEKFILTAGPCAADDYWVTIQGGAFTCSDDSGFGVPSGHTLRGDWGASGTTASSGDDRHPAPERLNLTWFAYAEDTFYQGEFVLPQEKIYQLLKQGSWDIEKKSM